MLLLKKKLFSFLIKLKFVLKMRKEDAREKIMQKFLENPNRSYNSIPKEL